ncbi:MAG: LPXTG cell wall anchor domain-containing protein, partial [Clostridia bacterium]|nr:LPXTG cell wall anchor domain-containing protein [Clostridia bacterium]
TYNQSNSSLSLNNNGVIHQNETDPYTLTVTNNAGYVLPSTGGPGTRIFKLLGGMMITLAGAGFIRLRWKRRAG